MKTNLLKRVTFLVSLFLCAHAAWAESTDIYFVALTAQQASESTGAGQVQLTLVDIKGKPMTDGDFAGLNASNPSGYSEVVTMKGATLSAVEGIETDMVDAESQMYITSYAYYKAETQPAKGSYFAGWNVNSLYIDKLSLKSQIEGHEMQDSIVFKVLSSDGKNKITILDNMKDEELLAAMQSAMAVAQGEARNVYAVFKRYLLSNPSATGAQLVGTSGTTATISVSMDVEGDADNWTDADMDIAHIDFTDNESKCWEAINDVQSTKINALKTRVTIPITFTLKEGMNAGVYKSTVTVKTAGENPSVLQIPLSVTILDENRPEAILYDGKVEQKRGKLTDLLGENVSGYTNPILQLHRENGDLNLDGKNLTLDLNGNNVENINITSGNVTIAYSKFGGTTKAVTVNGGKLILNGGECTALTIAQGATVEQNGATITGAVDNRGALITTEGQVQGGLTTSGTLTINGGSFAGENAITITDGTALLKRGSINGTTCGVLTRGGTTTIEKLAAVNGGTNSVKADGGTVNVNCGKFGSPLNGNITFISGYFKTKNYGVSTDGKTELSLTAGAEYNEGYHYFLGTQDAAKNNGVGVCRIGETSYATLEDALAYANNNKDKEVIIFMTNNYTLPAGYYTLPEKATIVVPMDDNQEKLVNETAPKMVYNGGSKDEDHYTNHVPTEYRRLTFAKGVNMDVFGTIEITSHQYSSNEAYTGQPIGPYGHLVMEEGSYMTLQKGSQLRAWGFMTGKGETDARRGATVHEFFQMGDWKGAFTSVQIVGMAPDIVEDDSGKKIFPVTQYFIQNIESPVKYHPGAVLTTAAAVSESILGMNFAMAANDIKIIGVSGLDKAIFLMDNMADADNTWVEKSYIANLDIQNYDVNSGAYIGSMVIDIGTISLMGQNVPIILNSANFDLPITSNMKLHLRSGFMEFTQNTSLIPGSEVEVDKESTVTISMNPDDREAKKAGLPEGTGEGEHVYHSGALYVYDAADWGKYAYQNEKGETGQGYTKIVRYAPSWNDGTNGGRPNLRKENEKPNSAKINVHGTFKTEEGYVYTSKAGADIFSSNADAGTFISNNSAADAGTPMVSNISNVQLSGLRADVTFDDLTFYPAYLKNGDDSYTKTYTDETHFADAGEAYCYTNDKWSVWKVAENDDCFMTDGSDYYAKPQEYVKVVVVKDKDGNPTFDEKSEHFRGNDDYTYSDAAGLGRLFIIEGECQWWEVEKKDNLYHCIHPDNDTYYEWKEVTNEDGRISGEWVKKTCTITWQNWDGNTIKTSAGTSGETDSYSVPYGTMAEFLGSNPTRDADIDYTYDFTGWTPALGKVTSDVTYTATYERKSRKYTITFCNEGGSVIERQFLTHNEVPVCENVPTKIGHYLQWSPAIAAVTGDATYTATWLEEKPTEYEVRFVDYDGTELQKGSVTVGIKPTAPTEPGNKPATNEFSYIFDHWSPEIHAVDAAITYTAVYNEVPKTYTVTFQNEDGSEIETNQYAYGEVPVCSKTPTKANDAQYTYTFAWAPQVKAVRGNTVYKATWTPTTNKYIVTLRSNNDAVCTFTGAGIYDYGTKVAIAANVADGYEFVRWEEQTGGANLGEIEITDNITLTAVVKTKGKEISDLSISAGTEVDAATLPNKEVMNLIITSNRTTSGQLKNADQLTVDGTAYFNLSLDFAANTWYAFGLPWRVNTNGGISVNGRALVVDNNCYILEYDGARRASGNADAKNGYWNYVHAGATLQPGRLYMLYLTNGAQTVRFAKAPNTTLAPVVNTTINVAEYGSAVSTDAGWNGIANPTTCYAALTSGVVTKGQKYIPGRPNAEGTTDRYETFTLATENLAVGQPLFVQVNTTKTLVADESNRFLAPRRVMTSEDALEYELRIAPVAGDYTDRLYVSAMDEKDDAYVIGQDVAKISVSRGVAQLWVERYDAKLSVNATEWNDNKAAFPLGIYAPTAGNYDLSTVTSVPNDKELLLTCDGLPVKDLSTGTYTATLQAGTTGRYGLLLVHKTPQITTDGGMVETNSGDIRKVLVGGRVYIIRDGNIYSIFGQQIQ